MLRIYFIPLFVLLFIWFNISNQNTNYPSNQAFYDLNINHFAGSIFKTIGTNANEKSPRLKNAELAQAIKAYIVRENETELDSLYKPHEYFAFWDNDSITKQGITFIYNSLHHGLNPQDYHINEISKLKYLVDSTHKISDKTKLDLLLSKNILLLCQHLNQGKLNPMNFHFSWNFKHPSNKHVIDSLCTYLSLGKTNKLSQYFEPKNQQYKQLKKELIQLLNTSNTYTKTTINDPGFTLRKGDSNQYVLPLKKFFYPDNATMQESMAFDDNLKQLVVAFQEKHGLTADGIVGKQSYYFLNWDKQRYIDALKLNLERLRWLNGTPITQGIWVNIPSYQLNLYQADTVFLSTKIIVGKYNNQTPIFGSALNYLVYNPCWTVPHSIAINMLPKLKNDPYFLENRNMFMQLNGQEIDADTVDFSQYDASNFPYKIFQRTQDDNALGLVKFMFDNPYSIYLHDTPSKNLFNKDIRAFSHGCIRVQNAMSLAETILLNIDKQTTPISYYTNKGYPEKVYLNKTIPLQITYLSCLYHSKLKKVVYYRDIYGYDYKLIHAITK